MKGNLGNMMRQAQQMQENLQKAQAEIAATEIVGEAGGGMVRVVMSGTHEVRRVTIAPELLDEDREMIEDLVAAAVNDAVKRIESIVREKMSGLAGGLSLPPGVQPF